jgi:hypothetical protein
VGAGDGAQQASLVVARRKSLAREADPGDAHQRQEEPADGGKDLRASSQLLDPVEQLLSILVEFFKSDHRPRAAAPPRSGGRARDVEAVMLREGAAAAHLIAETVVVRAARLTEEPHPSKVTVISRMSQVRTRNSRKSWRAARHGHHSRTKGAAFSRKEIVPRAGKTDQVSDPSRQLLVGWGAGGGVRVLNRFSRAGSSSRAPTVHTLSFLADRGVAPPLPRRPLQPRRYSKGAPSKSSNHVAPKASEPQ